MSFTLFLPRCYGSRTPSLCSQCGREGPWAPIAEILAPWLMPQWEMWWARCCLGFSGATSLSATCTEPEHGFKLSKLMALMSVLLWEEKHLAVFYPSWAGNHARLILFTSLGSCCLQLQHSWCPCCKPSTWSNPDDAFPKLWHHSSQIVSWGTAVPSEAPVLQTHWQTYPGAIKPGVTSPGALFPLQDQGCFGVPHLHVLSWRVRVILSEAHLPCSWSVPDPKVSKTSDFSRTKLIFSWKAFSHLCPGQFCWGDNFLILY